MRFRHRNCRDCVAAQPIPGAQFLEDILPLPADLVQKVVEFWGDWVLSNHIFERKMRKIQKRVGNGTQKFDQARDRLRGAVSGRDWNHDGLRDWLCMELDDLPARQDNWSLDSGRLWDIPMEDQLSIIQKFVKGDEYMEQMKLLYYLWDRFMGTDEGLSAANKDRVLGLQSPEARMRAALRTIIFSLDEFDAVPQDEYCRYGYYRPRLVPGSCEPPDPDLLPPPGSYFRNFHLLCAYPLLVRSRGIEAVALMFERAASRHYNDAHEGIFFALYHWDFRSNPAAGFAMLRRMISHWQTNCNIVLGCAGTGIRNDQMRISNALWQTGVINEEDLLNLWNGT